MEGKRSSKFNGLKKHFIALIIILSILHNNQPEDILYFNSKLNIILIGILSLLYYVKTITDSNCSYRFNTKCSIIQHNNNLENKY